jgi:hypothetical protein
MKFNSGIIFIPILFIFNSNLYAQESEKKLPVNHIIGTNEYFDYSDNSLSTTINTKHDVFDGDLSTGLATYLESGGWIGLDLLEKHVITKISYCPRKFSANNMTLGIFEGANNPDFGDAIPLFIIKETPLEDEMATQTINCSRGFRYIRYVSPANGRCNIAELEFYGYKGDGNDANLFQLTNLPVVSIHTQNSEDVIVKDLYLKGFVSIISENGSKIFTDSLEIKGRGNASWTFPKKPYRIKLYNKASLLDMPAKEKSWTLINNYGDKSLMRNLLAFDLSRRFELSYSPAGKAVDVILNGEYKGTYQLCDQIEVAKNRIDIEKMSDDDIAYPNITGGYLLEIDAYANQELSWFESANAKIPVTIKYPKDDEIVPEQRDYIETHFNKMEDALFSSNYTSQTDGYRKYIDIESFIRLFLIGEISGNTDAFWSIYLYKMRNEDSFHFGPVWDFDIAFENDARTFPINNNQEWISFSTGSSANGVRKMANRMFSDSEFFEKVKSIYSDYRNQEVISEFALLEAIDNYSSQLYKSQELNFKRWNIMNDFIHQNPMIHGSYEAEVENIKDYIANRIIWMDNKLNYNNSGPITHIEIEKNNGIYVQTEASRITINNLPQDSRIEVIDLMGRSIASISNNTKQQVSIESGKGIFLIHTYLQNDGKYQVVKCIVP